MIRFIILEPMFQFISHLLILCTRLNPLLIFSGCLPNCVQGRIYGSISGHCLPSILAMDIGPPTMNKKIIVVEIFPIYVIMLLRNYYSKKEMSSASAGLRPFNPPDHYMLAQTCSHTRHVV